MTDLRPTIVPKSDQQNADDLIGRTITIKITKVLLTGVSDQPVAIHFEGDEGKPYKPGKSMRRVMVKVWGGDGAAYVGRSMRLYRDDKVQFGGFAVGGIRISHMSDIDGEITMALTASRANRKPFTVRPLPAEQRQAARQEPRAQQASGQPSGERVEPGAGPPPGEGGAPVEESPSSDASNDAAKRDTLAGPDVDILDWAASWNRGLAQLDTVAEVVEAVKAAKAGGYVLKLRGSNPGMAKALMEAADARVSEIEGARE